ncbi:MAG TPA: bifunctional alpha/beta hydrolase/class I SAM-dependent methyltransferase [Burkholderiales bacterium]
MCHPNVPHLAAAAARVAREAHFASHDGTALFYRHWPAQGVSRGAILVLHRGHEHSGRVQHIVEGLELPEFDVFAWDARGHGRSPGARGYARDCGELIRDLDGFSRHIAEEHGIARAEQAVLAMSVASVFTAAWVHDYAPGIRAMVLASPAFSIKLYVPGALPGLRLLEKLKPGSYINSYVKGHLLTHDAARAASYDADPLVTKRIAVNILNGLFDTAQRVVEDAAAIHTPTLLLTSARDHVVREKPQQRFFERLGAVVKQHHTYPGFYHDTFGERQAHLPIGHARAFLLEAFSRPLKAPDLRDADLHGHTKAEFDALARPLPSLAPTRLQFAMTRLSMRTLGRASAGIRLGLATGFDSGSTLDYVYRNQAQGCLGIGRLIDRQYLDSIGWRGIRLRRAHLQELLRAEIGAQDEAGITPHIVDIAAGHGRYVLDVLRELPRSNAGALLRDYSALNVEQGRRLAEELHSYNVTFQQGDAFDEAALAQLVPRPSIAIVSGLYELFPGNAQVRASLAGLARAVPRGGCLIYTSQPWHPQVELIARTLTSHRDGAPWIMRRRSQAEMDQLVAEAGFVKERQLMDPWGIFGVSIARRA